MDKIIRLLRGSKPTFRNLQNTDIPASFMHAYYSPIFFTPRYQKISFSHDFLRYIRYLRRKDKITKVDLKSFVENLITQYHTIFCEDHPDHQLHMTKQHYIPPFQLSSFHGHVDWIFKINHKMTPVMFCPSEIQPAIGIGMAISNMYLRKSQEKEKNMVNGYSIVTTGHEWQLFRVDSDLKLKKTVILQGQKGDFRSIFEDQEMIATVMGMLEYSLELGEEKVNALEKAYEYLDEKKYMIEAETKEEAEKISLVSKLILAYYKRKM